MTITEQSQAKKDIISSNYRKIIESKPKDPTQFGFLVTLFEEDLSSINITLIDNVGNPIIGDWTLDCLAQRVIDEVMVKHTFSILDNRLLIIITRTIDEIMNSKYSFRYTGVSKARRAKLIDKRYVYSDVN